MGSPGVVPPYKMLKPFKVSIAIGGNTYFYGIKPGIAFSSGISPESDISIDIDRPPLYLYVDPESFHDYPLTPVYAGIRVRHQTGNKNRIDWTFGYGGLTSGWEICDFSILIVGEGFGFIMYEYSSGSISPFPGLSIGGNIQFQ